MQEKLSKSQDSIKEQFKAASQLFDEASKKLDAALKAKDLTAVKEAQGMLTGAIAMRDKAESLQRETDPLQQRVKKRTTPLMETMFQNQSKKKTGHDGRDDEDPDPDNPDAVFI